jgi:hypothetical protein
MYQLQTKNKMEASTLWNPRDLELSSNPHTNGIQGGFSLGDVHNLMQGQHSRGPMPRYCMNRALARYLEWLALGWWGQPLILVG